MNKLFAIILIIFSSINTTKSDLTIIIENISNNNGQLIVGIYNSEASFLKKPLIRKKVRIVNNRVELIIKDVEYGEYAISIVHDENNNNKIDFHFYGPPSEKTAASNNAKSSFGPPKWEDAKFLINKDVTSVNIKM